MQRERSRCCVLEDRLYDALCAVPESRRGEWWRVPALKVIERHETCNLGGTAEHLRPM